MVHVHVDILHVLPCVDILLIKITLANNWKGSRTEIWRAARPQTGLTGLSGHLIAQPTNQNSLTFGITHVISGPRPAGLYKRIRLNERRDLSEFRRSLPWEKRSHGSISELECGKPSSRRNCWVLLCSQRRRVRDREARVFLRRWPYLKHKVTDPKMSKNVVRLTYHVGCWCSSATSRALSGP